MQEILDRLGEVERVNTKLKKKDKDKFTFTKKGCENQFKFNNKVKDIAVDRMRVELRKHFKTLPPKIDELIKEGEKEIDDGNHKLKIANDYGFKAVRSLSRTIWLEMTRRRRRSRGSGRRRRIERRRRAVIEASEAAGAASEASEKAVKDTRIVVAGAASSRTRSSTGAGLPGTATRLRPRTSGATPARASGIWPGTAPSLMCPRVGSEEE